MWRPPLRRATVPRANVGVHVSRSKPSLPIRAAIAFCALAAARGAHAQRTQTAPSWTRYTLSNGLEVILEERHDTPRVAVEVDYHVGQRDQPPGYSGLAHLCEHMMFTWARAEPNGDAMQFLNSIGTERIVGETWIDRTRYLEVVSSSMLDRALAFESDRMGFLLDHLRADRLESQQQIIYREREERSLAAGARSTWPRIVEALYGDSHPYRFGVEDGVEEQLLTLDNVRWFHQTWYTPSNATLVVVGDFDTERTRATIARYFGTLARVPRRTRAGGPIPSRTGEQRIEIPSYLLHDELRVIWHSPPLYAQDDAELDLVADVLTANESSRLTRRIEHDSPIAHDVSAEQMSQELTSTFEVYAHATDNNTADALLTHVDAEIQRLRTTEIPADELDRLRATRMRNLRDFEATLAGRAFSLGLYASMGGDLWSRERDATARYQRVTPASLRSAAQRWLGAQRIVAITRAHNDPRASRARRTRSAAR